MSLAYEHIRSTLAAQPLFEDKTWQLSPDAWPVPPDQLAQLEAIGAACLEFHQALETLYLRSVAGKNLLRNKPLLAPWVADYLDRGKPAALRKCLGRKNCSKLGGLWDRNCLRCSPQYRESSL
jgi:hypothetical protein